MKEKQPRSPALPQSQTLPARLGLVLIVLPPVSVIMAVVYWESPNDPGGSTHSHHLI